MSITDEQLDEYDVEENGKLVRKLVAEVRALRSVIRNEIGVRGEEGVGEGNIYVGDRLISKGKACGASVMIVGAGYREIEIDLVDGSRIVGMAKRLNADGSLASMDGLGGGKA